MNQVEGVLEGDGEIIFRGGGLSLRLGEKGRGLRDWRGKRVVLGVRPEDIHAGDPGGESPSFRGRVEVVEPLGSETLLSVQAGESTLTVRLPSGWLPGVGEEMTLVLDGAHIHLFTLETGEALAGG